MFAPPLSISRAAALALTVLIPGAVHAAPPIEGRASVIDGDTFDLGRERVRILGVDSPELDQSCSDAAVRSWPCGQRAKAALRAWLGTAAVRCVPAYRDQGGRPVARCAARGRDIGGWLVENDWALDFPRYSEGAYRIAEQGARRRRIGVWAGTITPPWEWRAARGPSGAGHRLHRQICAARSKATSMRMEAGSSMHRASAIMPRSGSTRGGANAGSARLTRPAARDGGQRRADLRNSVKP